MSSFSKSDKPASERSSFGDEPAPNTPPPAPQVGVGEDVAKGFGSGVERGVVGLPGIPGDLSELIRAAYLRVQGLYGPEVRQQAEQMIPPRSLPTSGEVIQAATPYVPGIDYQPQTFAGRTAQTVGEMTPGAVIPGGIATRGAALGTKLGRGAADFALQAVTPGVAAEGAQELAGGENAPGWVKPAAAIGTSIATGHVPVPGATPRVPGVAQGASDRLNRAAVDEGGYPAVRQTLDELGPEGRLIDAGPNFVRQGEALVSMPGEAQPTILKAVRDRQAGIRDRISAAVNRTLGNADDYDAHAATLVQQRKAEGDKLYTAARNLNTRIDVQPVIADIESRLPLSVIADATRATPMEAALLDARAKIQNRSDVTSLHSLKESLDDAVSVARKAGNNSLATQIGGVRDNLVRQLEQGTVDPKTGSSLYGEARKQYRSDSQLIEAHENGLSVFDRTTRPLTFRREFNALPAAEQEELRRGAREAVEILMDEARVNAVNVRNKLTAPGNEAKLHTLLGHDAARNLLRTVEQEARMAGTAGRMEGQAATAGRLAAQKEFPSELTAPELPLAQRTLSPGQLAMMPFQEGWKRYVAPLVKGEREAGQAATNIGTARGLVQENPADLLAQLQRAYEQGPRRVMPGVQPGFAAYGANLDEDRRRR